MVPSMVAGNQLYTSSRLTSLGGVELHYITLILQLYSHPQFKYVIIMAILYTTNMAFLAIDVH